MLCYVMLSILYKYLFTRLHQLYGNPQATWRIFNYNWKWYL